MVVNDLSLLNAGGTRRISFSQTFALLVAQALTDANERLLHYFPALSSATWVDVLRQLQPDLLMNGQAVAFNWPGLARLAQNLVVFPWVPVLSPATDESGLPELGEQSITYRQQAIRALAELRETPGAHSLLACALLTDLAYDNAAAASVFDVSQG